MQTGTKEPRESLFEAYLELAVVLAAVATIPLTVLQEQGTQRARHGGRRLVDLERVRSRVRDRNQPRREPVAPRPTELD